MARILVVDDDEGMLAVLRDIMSHAGHEVVEAKNSDDAKRMYFDEAVDLMITDFFMPTEGGIEVIRAVRKRDPEAKTILISAADIRDGVDLEAFAEQYGAQKAMKKPLDPEALVAAVDELLEEG